MSERRDRMLGERRDKALGERLDTIGLPHHGPGYWKQLDELVEGEAMLRRPARPRRRMTAAAAAGAAAAAVILLLALSLPSWVTGGPGRAIARIFLPPLQRSATPAKVSGDTVVWTSRGATNLRTGQYDVSVFAFDLGSGRAIALSTYPSTKQLADISTDLAVWIDARDGGETLYAYDFRKRREVRIAAVAPGSALAAPAPLDGVGGLTADEPAVSGTTVAWTDRRQGNGDIAVWEARTRLVRSVTSDRWEQQRPDIDGHLVVWEDGRDASFGLNGFYMNGSDIYGHDLWTGATFPVCTAVGEQLAPAIAGDIVVWEDTRNSKIGGPLDFDIYGYDLRSRREFPVAVGPGNQTSPAISGGTVVWVDDGVPEPGWNGRAGTTIQGCSLVTGARFAVCSAPGYHEFPSISGGTVIWCDLGPDASQLTVYGGRFVQHNGKTRVEPIVVE